MYEKQKIIVILNEEKRYAKKGNNPFAAVDKEIDLLRDREMLSTRPNGGLEVFGSVINLFEHWRAGNFLLGRAGETISPKILASCSNLYEEIEKKRGSPDAIT